MAHFILYLMYCIIIYLFYNASLQNRIVLIKDLIKSIINSAIIISVKLFSSNNGSHNIILCNQNLKGQLDTFILCTFFTKIV
jgi:hypothetical protein